MVTKEQIVDWVEHPVTQLYKRILEERIEAFSDLRALNIEETSMEDLAKNVVALSNYTQGMEDVLMFKDIFEGAEVLDD